MLKVNELYKSYGELAVLKGVTFCVEQGQAVAILGLSGAGKSTLLRCINFLESPQSGLVEIDGICVDAAKQDPKQIKALRRKTAMVFQNYNIFRNKTALENLTEPLIHVCKVPAPQARKQAADILERVGLQDKLNVYPAHLSGGQQQRVGIARAMAINPKVMLFDEPTSSLDPQWVGEVLEVIRGLIREHNTTILLVTHEMNFAREAADRILFMDEGRLVEDAPPQTFFTEPKHPQAIRFLSSING